MANFSLENRNFFEIAGKNRIFRKFAWKNRIFYPDPRPPKFQTRFTPLYHHGSCGLRLDDETVRRSAPWGPALQTSWMPMRGPDYHGKTCPLGPGRLPRQAVLNDLVFRNLVRTHLPKSQQAS